MHYSDCYEILKKLKNTTKSKELVNSLEQLEHKVHETSFIDYSKANHDTKKSIFELKIDFDRQQLNLVIDGIEKIIKQIPTKINKSPGSASAIYFEVIEILNNIKGTAEREKNKLTSLKDSHYHTLALKYATHYLPFNQSTDPFKGSDFTGYCWGHTHRYGKLASQDLLSSLSVASDATVYNTYKRNWTFSDILFRRVGWYFYVSQEIKIRQALWDAFLQLDDKTIFNFNFLINSIGFHSTSLRMVGEGIEYYDNNYGLVRFNNREDAVNFLANHLLIQAKSSSGEVTFISIYKLPYTNDAKHDILAGIPQAQLSPRTVPNIEEKGTAIQNGAIGKLNNYAVELCKKEDIKAKIKANEIKYLVQELITLSPSEVSSRVKEILANKNHSLIINRGSGLYFFASGFQSHSTTESLLQEIFREATAEKSSYSYN